MNQYSNTWINENSVLKYDITYTSYDQLYRDEQFSKYRYVFEEIGLKPGRVVLDIGCGTGLLIEYLFSKGSDLFEKYICVDPSVNMLSRVLECNRFDHRIIVINSYGENLPLVNNTADTIYLFTVWDIVVDKKKLLDEVMRVLSNKGYVLISSLEKSSCLKPIDYHSGFELIGCRIDCFYIYRRG